MGGEEADGSGALFTGPVTGAGASGAAPIRGAACGGRSASGLAAAERDGTDAEGACGSAATRSSGAERPDGAAVEAGAEGEGADRAIDTLRRSCDTRIARTTFDTARATQPTLRMTISSRRLPGAGSSCSSKSSS